MPVFGRIGILEGNEKVFLDGRDMKGMLEDGETIEAFKVSESPVDEHGWILTRDEIGLSTYEGVVTFRGPK